MSEERAEPTLLGLRWGICGYPPKGRKVNPGGTIQHIQKDKQCSL